MLTYNYPANVLLPWMRYAIGLKMANDTKPMANPQRLEPVSALHHEFPAALNDTREIAAVAAGLVARG